MKVMLISIMTAWSIFGWAQLPNQLPKNPPVPKPVDPKAAQNFIPSQNILNLTGFYRAECNATTGFIYLRKVSNEADRFNVGKM
jgi:hypothetical protein